MADFSILNYSCIHEIDFYRLNSPVDSLFSVCSLWPRAHQPWSPPRTYQTDGETLINNIQGLPWSLLPQLLRPLTGSGESNKLELIIEGKESTFWAPTSELSAVPSFFWSIITFYVNDFVPLILPSSKI